MVPLDFESFIHRIEAHPQLQGVGLRTVYQKGEYIFKQGEICQKVFCMHNGLVKLYYNTQDGKEWIKSFVLDQGVLGSRSSQLMGKPSPFSALCLEKTEVQSYPYKRFAEVCLDDHDLVRDLFNFLQWLGVKKEIREYQLLCLSAEDAYKDFLHTNPKLVERLTQVDIAHYLGITPIALSRIKKRLT
ncbi:MAG: Crp/Fnr family transcriptional regulator [Candidatus Polarisedimenticolaceae bacterium]|nr:Crp/Fnr family transcriptional regulator [Candidatus Polarisedimenticolaceae bacterium]